MAALLIKRIGCPVSQLSTKAISSAFASIASAIACKRSLRFAPDKPAQSGNASCAASHALFMSWLVPDATVPMSDSSMGELFINTSLLIESTH